MSREITDEERTAIEAIKKQALYWKEESDKARTDAALIAFGVHAGLRMALQELTEQSLAAETIRSRKP